MGNINLVRNHRNPESLNRHHRRIRERKQNIQIVDHHVIHHIDIEAARAEHPQTMYLKV